MSNSLILVSGQIREFETNAAQLKKFLQTNFQKNTHVLILTWDRSYSIFPKGYNSFIEDVSEEKVLQICNLHGIEASIEVVKNSDAIAYINNKLAGNVGVDDYSYIAYLLYRGLLKFFELESRLGIKFNSVIKIRPDLYLDGFSSEVISINDKAAFIHDPTAQFTIPGTFTIDSQYGDVFEVFGRAAFIAYGQMIFSIQDKVTANKPFAHTFPLHHLNSFGIKCQPLPCSPQIRNIVRPLYRVDDFYQVHNDQNNMIEVIQKMEWYWQNEIHDPDQVPKWLSLFDSHNIKYESRADRSSFVDCIIFDLDGVLVDSFEANKQSLIETVKLYGLEFDYAPILDQPIPTVEKLKYLEKTQNKYLGEERSKEFYKTKYDLLFKYFDLIKINPFAKQCIDELIKKGIKVSFASNARLDYIRLILEKIGIKITNAKVIGNDSGFKTKPNVDIFVHLAKLNNSLIGDTLVVDDYTPTIVNAAKAGFQTFHVLKFEDLEKLYK